MNNALFYRGYYAKPVYSIEDNIIYGQLLGITDNVNFHANNTKDIVIEFHRAVDGYIAFCDEVGKVPERPFSDKITATVGVNLHRDLAYCASKLNVTMSQIVREALSEKLKKLKRSL